MKKTNIMWVFAFGLCVFFLSESVVAQQNIGNSVYICDGAAQAGPCDVGGDDDTNYSQPAVKWADRWGAIADADNGVYGIVSMMSSKRLAQKSALNDCESRGGEGCEILGAYFNQCAAIASGDGGASWARAETEEIAIQDSVASCERKRGGCHVYYSGCSIPERIQ